MFFWQKNGDGQVTKEERVRGLHEHLKMTLDAADANPPLTGTFDGSAVTFAEAEAECAAQGMKWEWQEDGSLTMFNTTDGFLDGDDEPVWFSQASNFEPFTPSFGDGSEIPAEQVERMHAAMWRCAVAFDWERGDVLCLDNERCMHGRLSWEGPRTMLSSFARL